MEKTLILGKIEGRRRRKRQWIEMVGWLHQFNGHESEEALGDGEGQGSLAVHGVAKSQTRLSNSNIKFITIFTSNF